MKLIRELWYILTSRERIEGSILLCAMVLGAGFEAAGVGLVLPFIGILKEPELALKYPAAQPLLSSLGIGEPSQMLIAVGLALVVVLTMCDGVSEAGFARHQGPQGF